MDYVTPEAARDLAGLRLALTAGVPAPYSMSARTILDVKGVPYVPILQQGGGRNEALVAWTGHRNAPVAVYENEAPRAGWLDILNLAERLGSGPSLLPEDIDDRMRMVGLVNELIGENGMVWHMRVLMLGLGGAERAAEEAARNPMYQDYGYSEANREAALSKIVQPLERFTEFAHGALPDNGHGYFFGGHLSALDIYWIYFSQLFATLPDADCPTPKGLKKSYELVSEAVSGCDELLIAQRDWVISQHVTLPLTF